MPVLNFIWSIALAWLAACCSCTAPQTPVETLEFRTSFPLKPRHSGVFLDKASGQEYIYFGDAMTNKQILVFDMKASIIDTIPLSEALDRVGEIGGLSFLSMDKLVVSGTYNNMIAVIDRDGQILDVLDLNDDLTRVDSARYELWASSTSAFINGSNCFFSIALVANSVKPPPGVTMTNGYEEIKHFYGLNRMIPRLARVELSLREPVLSLELDSFYHKLHPGPFAMPESSHYVCINGRVLVFSTYSPTVQVLNGDDGSIITSFDVASRHTPAFVPPIRLDEANVVNLQDSVNRRLSTGGYIQTIAFDQTADHYLVVVVHRIPITSPPGMLGAARPFSIIEYDSSFRFVRETIHPARRYFMFSILSTRNGVYMQRWAEKSSLRTGVHVFEKIRTNAQ